MSSDCVNDQVVLSCGDDSRTKAKDEDFFPRIIALCGKMDIFETS